MLAGCADGGDAVSLLQVSAARVEVGKNGLTADGRIPSIEVESDGYWARVRGVLRRVGADRSFGCFGGAVR